MEEVIIEKIDGNTVSIRKVNCFKKEELDKIKIRMEAELAKVNLMLDKLK